MTYPNDPDPPCCGPATRGASVRAAPVSAAPEVGVRQVACDAVSIPAGKGLLGTNGIHIKEDGEGPLRDVRIKPFLIAPTTVTNAQFDAFVRATGHISEAERFGWSFVFWSDVSQDIPETMAVQNSEWWRRVDGATWRDINGPGTQGAAWRADHPVVHVSWNDAQAYAAWVGGRLPSEAEWEHAARGGQGDVPFPWGDTEPDDTEHLLCNIWQGAFPQHNTCADGYATTAPARSFAPNPYGLYNAVGNVWEWTGDPFRIKSLKKQAKARMRAMAGFKLSKGGSFLCHRSYCYRYRIAARSGTSPDSTTTHQGFRVAWDTA